MSCSRAWVVAAVVALLPLAGCTNDTAKPKPLPSKSASASSSSASSPSAAAPSLPAEAKGTNSAAAAKFARHYVALINYSLLSGSTTDLARASAKQCSGCQVIGGDIKKVYDGGGHVEGGRWAVRQVRVRPSPTGMTATLRIHIAKQSIFKNARAKPDKSDPHDGRLVIHLISSPPNWAVSRLEAFG